MVLRILVILPKKTLDISGFLIFNINENLGRKNSYREFTDADLGIPDEFTSQTSEESSDQGLLKLSASYKPNANNQLDYDVLGRISKDSQQQLTNSSVLGETYQLDESSPFSINQTLKYYYTLDDNNIFAFEGQHLLKNEDPVYSALFANDPTNNEAQDPSERDAFDNTAAALGFNRSLQNYDFGQRRNIKSNQLDAKLDYYHILNSKSNLNFTLGTILSRQNFDSNLFQNLADGSTLNPIPNFNDGRSVNDIEYNFHDLYLGFHYRLKTGKFTITPGFSLHSYGYKNDQFGTETSNDFFRVLPDFETRIQLKKSESLTFRYEMRNQFTDISKLAQGLVLNNINNVQYGNPDLQNAVSHNLNLFYSSFNLFNYTNVFGRLAYSKNIDQIRGRTSFENIIATSTFFNSVFADETISAFGRIQRTFGKIRGTFNTSFNYSKINQVIQDRPSINESYSQSYRPGIRTNFKTAPNVSVNYDYRIFTNYQGTNKTTFYTRSPSVELDAYIWKSITLKTDYTYTKQWRKGGESDDFKTWNISLSYRNGRDAKWEFEVQATNLLDIDARLSTNASNLFVASTETFVQPRFVTFRLRYVL